MAEQLIALGMMENLKILFVGIMLYAIIYAMLSKIGLFPSEKISALVALVAAIIVSFTGIVTYIVSYALNWFIIIFFITFLLLVLLLFLGVNFTDITSAATSNVKLIIIIFILLFGIIFIKGFFGVNNQFDNQLNNENYDPYSVDVSPSEETKQAVGFFERINLNFDSDLVQSAIFLLIVGVFVMLIGGKTA